MRKKTHEEFIKEVYEAVGNEYSVLGTYQNADTKVKMKHNKCGNEYSVAPSHFLSGKRCPTCQQNKLKKTPEEFKKEVYNLVGDEYILLEEYKNSKTNILIKHNVCGSEWRANPFSFLGGSRCPVCMNKLRIKNETKSHEQFCKDVFNLVGNEYIVLGEYKGNRNKILMKHNIDNCGYEWETLPVNFLAGSKCPKCQNELRSEKMSYTIDDVRKFVEKNSDCKLISTKYTNTFDKLNFRCKCGNEFEKSFNCFKNESHIQKQCPECGFKIQKEKLTKTHDEFIDEIEQVCGSEYIILEKYESAHTPILVKHITCGYEYKVSPSHILRGARCPYCAESKGEQRIRHWLEDNKYNFKIQYIFSDLKDKECLRFDFGVLDKYDNLVLLIEFDGIQHFEWIEGMMTKEAFKSLQCHDLMKNNYCEINNVSLLRIPYWEQDFIEKILSEKLSHLIN